MPWDMNDYPSSMKNLKYAVRKKAIDIANAMIDEGYEEGRAIPIATNQAKEWYKNASQDEIRKLKENVDPTERSDSQIYKSRPELMDKGEHVIPHSNGWAVQSQDAKKPSEVLDHKDEAVKRAKEIAKNKGTEVIIHKKNGKIQDRVSYKS
ncbi:DUF2188 domain-containing protein [Scopulibacillus cellulosilyticus]|uniref:DUF2188 domain-containing protein n=1 Tax=Scopulibacillus cellulosilyticus TaxID=2665665 RepID=A0ABW2Q0M2_9BACL